MTVQDFLNDDNGDLKIAGGDFLVGDSDGQHIEDIFQSFVGWWKQSPQVGIGISLYLNTSGTQQALEQSIKLQLQADGYSINSLKITSDKNGDMVIQQDAKRNGL